jgi:acyl-CoA thioester hydrolase
MNTYHFYHPIEVRYADIDAQRHVNNKCCFTYMEQARDKYLQILGLWDGRDFDKIGWVVAEQSCRYVQPIRYGQQIRVGVHASRLGNKSIELMYTIQDIESEEELASGISVQVAYDYKAQKSIPIPDIWYKTISQFEEIDTQP